MIYYFTICCRAWRGSTPVGRKGKLHTRCQVTEQTGSDPHSWLWLVDQLTTAKARAVKGQGLSQATGAQALPLPPTHTGAPGNLLRLRDSTGFLMYEVLSGSSRL